MTLFELPHSRISGKYLKAKQQGEKHIKKDYQMQSGRIQDQGEHDFITFKKAKVGHKLLRLQKPNFEASNFIGKCNTSIQKNHKLRLQLLL